MDQDIEPGAAPREIYDAGYYACHCGPLPYERSPYWLDFFGKIADELVRSLAPKRMLDAGCALGLLVESLWDRGVEAHGRDISSYAIANVRPDIRPYCEVGSVADPFTGAYDLVTCIEVLEHMPEDLAIQAIRSITAVAPRVFFSSSPDDFDEPTHVNVKPPIYWIRRFAEAGFVPVMTFDGTFLCHHAMLLERTSGPIDDRLLTGFAEIIRLRLETLKRDKQLHALYAGAKQAQQMLEAGNDLAESLRKKLVDEQLATHAAKLAGGVAAQARDALAGEKAALETELADRDHQLAQRDAVIASKRQAVADLTAFKAGVYRNPLFVLVRLTNRLWNMMWRVPRRCAGGLLRRYRDTPWARRLVGGARQSLPGRLAWRVLRRSGLVRGLVNRARVAGGISQPPPAPVPSAPPSVREAAVVGYVPPRNLLPWFNPLTVAVAPELAERPHLNVLLPGIGMKYMSGGPNTAVNLGYRLALLGVAVRFISTDVATDSDATAFWQHVRALADTDETVAHVELVDASNRAVPLTIGANDVFMATAWWTAQMAKYAMRHTRHRRFVYLIQDYEPLFHAASTPLALSNETYALDFIPVINTSFLADFLAENRIGRFTDPAFAANSLVFEPAVDTTRFHPVAKPRPSEAKRRLLFYARPTNATRNLFEIGVAALQKLVQDGTLDLGRWEIVAIGEQFYPVPLCDDVMLAPAPWLDFDSYAQLMREGDVLLSMMMSPHPSYPPLEMAACGRPVVTTCFGNKTKERLAALSPTIIGCEPTIEAIADGLVTAIRHAESGADPAAGIDLPRSWGESLRPILPRLHDQLLALLGAPAAGADSRFPGYRQWPHDHYAVLRPALLRERSERYTAAEPALLSLLTPVWNTDPAFIDALAETVLGQDSGPGLEWIVLDNGSDRADTIAALQRLAAHPAVRLDRVPENIGIIGGLRRCLEQARHRYIVPLDSDDLLTPDCVRVLTASLAAAGYPALAYTDEDKIEGERVRDAYFKPDWDPVLFVHSCYIAHLCAIDRSLAMALGCYSDPAPQGSHDWDSFMRFFLAGHVPHHVPEIVYSWRMHAQSTSGNFRSKDYIFASQRHVIERFVAAAKRPDDYRVEPSPLFPDLPDWRIVPAGGVAPKITTVLLGPTPPGWQVPVSAELVDHRVVRLDDPLDLASLASVAADCAAEGRLVHLLSPRVAVTDARFPGEAQALLDLFPDVTMIGGRIETNQVIVAADGYFGFGDLCDSPNRGRHLNDPGYFAQMWKPHSASAVSTYHAVVRADFLAAALAGLLGSGLDAAALGPWLGAAAARNGKRVVYSPFFAARSDEGMPLPPPASVRAAFLAAHGALIPERTLLSPHLGLTRETAYRPILQEERGSQERAARAVSEVTYGDGFAAELVGRRACAALPRESTRFSVLTSVYARTPAELFEATARALLDQSYRAAEWIVLENGPIPDAVGAVLDRLAGEPILRRLKVPENRGITGAMRYCLEQATGDYIVPLDADDLLTPDALQQLALGIERSDTPGLIFSDEDLLRDGTLMAPFRRADFDPILNASDSYIFHLCAFRRERALALGAYGDAAAEFCQDWDTLLRFDQAGERIAHVPLVLYHWRIHAGSISNSGTANDGSRASTRHVLESIVARQKNPDLYEVDLYPLHRGIDQYAILRRPRTPMRLGLAYVAADRAVSVPRQLTDLADSAIGLRARVAVDAADLAGLAGCAHVLVLRRGLVLADAAPLWEAMRLFEMHDDVALAGGRILDADGIVRDTADTGWIGMRRGDPGSYAMALKPQSAARVPADCFFCRLDLLRVAAAELAPDEWAARAAALAQARGLRIAYSPLIEATETQGGDNVPPTKLEVAASR